MYSLSHSLLPISLSFFLSLSLFLLSLFLTLSLRLTSVNLNKFAFALPYLTSAILSVVKSTKFLDGTSTNVFDHSTPHFVDIENINVKHYSLPKPLSDEKTEHFVGRILAAHICCLDAHGLRK
jgi:hypothetical protein